MRDIENEMTQTLGHESSQLDVIRNSVAIIHWATAADDHRNGSIFFIDTGVGLFGVTAKHVYQDYASAVAGKPSRCQIDNILFDPTERLISMGTKFDIATFRITPNELQTLAKLTIPWPPLIPDVGDMVLFAGFPGPEKKVSASTNSIDVRTYAAKWVIDSVSGRDVSMIRPPDSEVTDVNGSGFPAREYNFGGMSGGPVVAVFDRGPIFSCGLSGVIYELHQGFEIVKAARADFIREDGVVKC
jgi:hypothetical protein